MLLMVTVKLFPIFILLIKLTYQIVSPNELRKIRLVNLLSALYIAILLLITLTAVR